MKRLAPLVDDGLYDALHLVHFHEGILHLPFDPDQLVDNLLLERYLANRYDLSDQGFLRSVYYALRPVLPLAVRKRLQRFYHANWRRIRFPRWPVDLTVERILERCLVLLMKAQGLDVLPFIWFWPDAHDSCAIVTHDVETERGRNFCSSLMDIDDSVDIKSAFQIVPEGRYAVSPAFLSEIRDRGFEINVHDLNHDGSLFRNQKRFERQIADVNRYGKEFGARGFRAGVMYRNQEWFHALDFEYDMTVPNVAHLEPQHGGCCTVFPYFIGPILELPLTTSQDYSLFHLLNEFSMELWTRQIELIRNKHGLISLLIHPEETGTGDLSSTSALS